MQKFLEFKRLVMAKDINGANRLFGGVILSWIDELAYIHALEFMGSKNVVTRSIGQITFDASASMGDVVEARSRLSNVGVTSITLEIELIHFGSSLCIASAKDVVMVCVDGTGKPHAHGLTRALGNELLSANIPKERSAAISQ